MATKRILATVCLKTAVTLALLALFAPLMRAQQVQLSYFKNYFVTGDYLVGGVSLSGKTGSVSSSINFSGVPCTTGPGLFASVIPCSTTGAVPADVIAAFLYWQTIENTAPCAPVQCANLGSGTFNGAANAFSGVELGNPTVAACAAGGGTQANAYARVYRADVLRFLPINNTANVRVANGTQTFTLASSSMNTQFVGASLVVVYRLVTPGNPRIAPLRSVVIYDGSFTGTPGAGDLDLTMYGMIQAAKNPAPKMTHMVGNGKEGFRETLTVNGSIPSGQSGTPIDGDQGPGWDVDTFNYNLAANASSVETKVVLSSDCLSWAAIITSVNVQDSDFDGIPDIAEEYGLYFNPGVRYDGVVPLPSPAPAPTPATFGTCQQYPNTCLNLPKMGANPQVPDIFMQIDWMYDLNGTPNNPPHSHNPQFAALKMVGDVFKAHGINIHFDVGNDSPQSPYCQAANSAAIGLCNYQSQNSPYIILGTYAHGGNAVNEAGNYPSVEGPSQTLLCPNAVTMAQMAACAFPNQSNLYSVLGWKFGLDAIRDGDPVLGLLPLFPQDEKDTVHYALFGHALAATTPLSTPNAGSISGVADHPGGDILVTLGLWRSDIPAVDQVGTLLDQAGTLMHELGHNLGLSHGGWRDTPTCMPDYPSVMNYLYQVAGLTDSAGNEHLDYSYGLLLPLAENDLSVKIPMGLQAYRVRYFGPFNSNSSSPLANTPGQASQAYCSGGYPTVAADPYVRLEWPSISTPDWSNGTVPSGTKLPPLDTNYDGTSGNNPGIITNETFTDSPDWLSINLQQVSARPAADGFSLNLGLSQIGLSQIGLSQIGLSQIGLSQIGLSQIGLSQIGLSQIGISDAGTAALGQDALGDQNYASFILSGGVTPPTGLAASITSTAPPAPLVNPNPGGTGILLGWTPYTGAQAQSYNIYACNATAGACTPTAPPIGSAPGGTQTPSFSLFVNDFTDAAATCPASKICYNTPYNIYVTEVVEINNLSTESGHSNTVTSEVNHIFTMGNISPTSVTYGTANPAITMNTYPTAGALAGSNAACVYTTTPVNVMGSPYTITCTGPSVYPANSTVGVTYNAPYLTYTPSTLTITTRPVTATLTAQSKPYDGTPTEPSGNMSCSLSNAVQADLTNNSVTCGVPSNGTFNSSQVAGANPANTVNATATLGGPGATNYTFGAGGTAVASVGVTATPVNITPAPLTASIIGTPTKPYDSTTTATLTPANFSLTGLASGESFTVTQTAGTYNSANVATATTVTASLAAPANFKPGVGTVASNYTFPTTASGSGSITPAPVTAAIVAAGKSYDTTTAATATCSLTSGVFSADTGNVGCVASGGMFASPNAGTWGVTAALGLSGSAAGNYKLSSVTPGSATIIQYLLTVGATGVNKDFDGTTNATVTLSDNRVPGDNSISDSYMGASFVNAGPGTGITVNVNEISISGPGVGNYSLQNTTATTTANISDNIDLSALSMNGVNYGSNTTALPIWNGSMLQLTNNSQETASAWLPTAIPVSSPFTTTFQFQITPATNGPNSIGDGFAFVIQGSPTGKTTLGSTGFGQYIGYAGIQNSIAIEFDTYYNSDYGDPTATGISDAHVGIQSLGTLPNTSDHDTPGANLGGPTLYNFADGNQHTATITYDGTTLSVFLDQSTNPNAFVTAAVNLNTLLGLNGGPAYVGFTAATGGAQEADILGSTWTWDYSALNP